MSAPRKGFFVEQVSITGGGLPTAEVTLDDGLNVIAGASDTGKSYLCNLIDFAFGASKPPQPIEAAKGYERVIVRLKDRSTRAGYQIERAVTGGDALILSFDADGNQLEERVAVAKHDANDSSTLSAFLLTLSGFEATKVRKNKKGEARTLSFRDLAFLCVVDEARIIAELPPHLSGSRFEATAEGDVLRLLVTGRTAAMPIAAPKKAVAHTAKAQTELLVELQDQVRAEIAALGLEPDGVRQEFENLEAVRTSLLQAQEESRVELVALERQLAGSSRELLDSDSRLVVLEGLLGRFQLLDGHYDSDISRLVHIEETGTLLESVPAKSCPVCGAAPAAHRSDDAAEHFGVSTVREAAAKELEKTKALRHDLGEVLTDLRLEMAEKEARCQELRDQLKDIQSRINGGLQPRARASLDKVREQDARRDSILRARILVEQLEDLDKRVADAAEITKRAKATKSEPAIDATTSEMEPFVMGVQEILSAWRYPELGHVVFSEDTQDLVIGGQERASHGKGVRALTCAAFLTGLLRHCWKSGLPHPGIVVLDSPLVAYRDPDHAGSESARLRQSDVKDAFFRTLAEGLSPGQIIVLENEDPPTDVAAKILHHHFSKARATGRYGLFPGPR